MQRRGEHLRGRSCFDHFAQIYEGNLVRAACRLLKIMRYQHDVPVCPTTRGAPRSVLRWSVIWEMRLAMRVRFSCWLQFRWRPRHEVLTAIGGNGCASQKSRRTHLRVGVMVQPGRILQTGRVIYDRSIKVLSFHLFFKGVWGAGIWGMRSGLQDAGSPQATLRTLSVGKSAPRLTASHLAKSFFRSLSFAIAPS